MALCVPNQTGMFHLIPIQSTFAQESEKNQPLKWRIQGSVRDAPQVQILSLSRSFQQKICEIISWRTPSGVGATAFIHRIKSFI